MALEDSEIRQTPKGFEVIINKRNGAKLPGYFTNQLFAEKAQAMYFNKPAVNRNKKECKEE